MNHLLKVPLTIGLLGVLLLVALATASTAGAADNLWTGAVSLDYNVPGNWIRDGESFVPDAQYDEIAVINNGNAVFLSSDTGEVDPSGLALGTESTLEIRSGGRLDVVLSQETPGLHPGNISVSSSSGLVVRSGGTLTAVGTANLSGTTRLVGPAATFSAGGFNLAGSHTLVAEITNASSHSPLTSPAGDVNLGGTLALEFNGVTPSLGSSWTIADAARVNGQFANVTGPSLPLGQQIFVSTSAGGNGQQVTATIANQLLLSINSATGVASIHNLWAGSDEEIDAYSITDASGHLNPGGWKSLQSEGGAGWEAANAAGNHLSELNLNGSLTIAGNSSIDLGALYATPTHISLLPPSIGFSYRLVTGEVRTGVVAITPNTLVLQVDPSSGETRIINPSGFDVELDGYSITSLSGALDSSQWSSLQGQGHTGWEEANAGSTHLSELNLEGSLTIENQDVDSGIPLGKVFVGGGQDLQFSFHLPSSAIGDYNSDGVVDAADYTVWRNNLGAPAGTLPNDSATGPIGIEQYHNWKANFGTVSTGGGMYVGLVEYVSWAGGPLPMSQPVPEPATWLLIAAGLAALGRFRQKGNESSFGSLAKRASEND